MLNTSLHRNNDSNLDKVNLAQLRSKLLFYAILEYERYLLSKSCQMQ